MLQTYPWKTKLDYPIPGEQTTVKGANRELVDIFRALREIIPDALEDRGLNVLRGRWKGVICFWVNPHNALSAIDMHPYMMPSALDPGRPLILRIDVARHGWDHLFSRRFLDSLRSNRRPGDNQYHKWGAEISILPHEASVLAEWIAEAAFAHDRNDPKLISDPPIPLINPRPQRKDYFNDYYFWSETGWDRVQAYYEDCPQQIRRMLSSGHTLKSIRWKKLCPELVAR